MPKIQLGEQLIPYTIRESKRARYVRLKIDPYEGLQVVIPHGKTISVDGLLRERQRWILKHLHRLQTVQSINSRQYVSGDQLPFLGTDHTLEVISTRNGKRTTIARQAQTIRVRLQSDLHPDHHSAAVREALEYWYREQARHYIRQRTKELAKAYGFIYGRLTIRGQKTRWGSCSSKGNLNFNWRLMMTPPEAIDYVIIHELCHLRVLNHSSKFWKLVAQYCPDYQHWKKWLKEHDARLHL